MKHFGFDISQRIAFF